MKDFIAHIQKLADEQETPDDRFALELAADVISELYYGKTGGMVRADNKVAMYLNPPKRVKPRTTAK